MPRPIRFAHRMSDADALMWNLEKDPLLRSTINALWIFDRPLDRARMLRKVDAATRTIPRLRQRVVSNPWSLAPPRWEVDPFFDLHFHFRDLRAPGDGSLRGVLDLMRPLAMQGFDRARPLWELYAIDGLEGGRAAMLMKLHHSLSDGVGLVRMTTSLIETGPEPAADDEMPPEPPVHVLDQWERLQDAASHEWRRLLGRVNRITASAGGVVASVFHDPMTAASQAVEIGASVGRLMEPISEPLSPIMRDRSLSIRFDLLEFPLSGLRDAAKRAGCKLNDAFVAGVAGGLRLYHERRGAYADELRMSMPINLRSGENAARAGNQFAPARFAVPVGILDPIERMEAIRDLVGEQRHEPALGYVDDVAGFLNRLPTSVSTALFGTMLKGIDFVTSNVPGPPFEVWMAGARIERVVGFGPLTGAAMNITLFSYCDRVELGISTDPAAVPDPELLLGALRDGFAEVLEAQPS